METTLQSNETTIDHVGVVARDIAALRATYLKLGFAVTAATPLMQPGPDGKGEVSLGQLSAHVVFPSSYLELTAVRHPGQGNHLDKWLERREGLHILAFHSADAAGSYRELSANGLVLPPIRNASRRVNAGGVSGVAQFKWFELPDSIAREGFACVVQHLTPDMVFVPTLTHHANGARGIRSVFVVVDDMEAAFTRYRLLPGTQRRSFAVGRSIVMKHQQLIVVDTKGFGALFTGLKPMVAPALGGVSLTVADISVTRRVLGDAGVPFQVWGEKSLWVAPDHAGGAVLVFVDESAPG